MKKLLLTFLFISLLITPLLFAQEEDETLTLEEAKALSAQTGKPILIEFVRSD